MDYEENSNEMQLPIEVSLHALSEDALKGVIESFILREGTDYGQAEVSYDSKENQIRRQLEKGEVHIVFDPNTESVTLMTER